MTGLPDGVSPFPPLPDGVSLLDLHKRVTQLEYLVAFMARHMAERDVELHGTVVTYASIRDTLAEGGRLEFDVTHAPWEKSGIHVVIGRLEEEG